MPAPRTGHASVNLGATKDIARRLVAQGRFESVSEACREGLRRLDFEQRIVEKIVALGEEGMASGVAEGFDSAGVTFLVGRDRNTDQKAKP